MIPDHFKDQVSNKATDRSQSAAIFKYWCFTDLSLKVNMSGWLLDTPVCESGPLTLPLWAGWLQRWLRWRRRVAITTCVISGPSASLPSSWQSCSRPCLTCTQWGESAQTMGTGQTVGDRQTWQTLGDCCLDIFQSSDVSHTVFQSADADVQEQLPASKT